MIIIIVIVIIMWALVVAVVAPVATALGPEWGSPAAIVSSWADAARSAAPADATSTRIQFLKRPMYAGLFDDDDDRERLATAGLNDLIWVLRLACALDRNPDASFMRHCLANRAAYDARYGPVGALDARLVQQVGRHRLNAIARCFAATGRDTRRRQRPWRPTTTSLSTALTIVAVGVLLCMLAYVASASMAATSPGRAPAPAGPGIRRPASLPCPIELFHRELPDVPDVRTTRRATPLQRTG